MANNFLDKAGLSYFWGKIKSYVTSQLGTKQDKLPTGSAGQMLYQGESGPGWGIPPYLGSMPQLDYSQMKSLHALGITDLNDVVDPGTYVGMSDIGGYPEIANIPEGLVMPFFYMNVYVFDYPGDGYSKHVVEQHIYQIIAPYVGFNRYGTSDSPEQALFFNLWIPNLSAAATKMKNVAGISADNVQGAIEEVNAKATPKAVSVTLPSTGWASNSQTVTVQGVVADETAQLIQPMPAIASQAAYMAAGIYCSGQAANSLTFTCQTAPTENITVYVVMQEVSA